MRDRVCGVHLCMWCGYDSVCVRERVCVLGISASPFPPLVFIPPRAVLKQSGSRAPTRHRRPAEIMEQKERPPDRPPIQHHGQHTQALSSASDFTLLSSSTPNILSPASPSLHPAPFSFLFLKVLCIPFFKPGWLHW